MSWDTAALLHTVRVCVCVCVCVCVGFDKYLSSLFPPVREGVFGQCETPKDPRYPDCPSKMDVSLYFLNSLFFKLNILSIISRLEEIIR